MNLEQYIPETIGLAVGYAGGLRLDQFASKRAASETKAVLQSLAMVDTVQIPGLSKTKTERFLSGLGHVTPKLAFALGLTAATATAAFYPLETNIIKPATIEVVIDHSGATGLSVGGQKPVLSEINQVASAFTPNNRISSEAFVASFGGVVETQVSKVDSLSPSGYAPLDVAVNEALDQTAVVKNGDKLKNTAVVVITNGNTIGSPNVVISQSNKQDKTPVYIVDVEATKGTSIQDASSYRSISTRTGAKYWTANDTNINTVTSEVEQALISEHQQTRNNPNKVLDIFVALASGLIGVKEYRQRRRGHIQRNLGGK